MLNAVSDIRKIVAAPDKPLFAMGDWSQIEVEVGLALPRDNKQLINTYRSG
jgi:hypothetical protein